VHGLSRWGLVDRRGYRRGLTCNFGRRGNRSGLSLLTGPNLLDWRRNRSGLSLLTGPTLLDWRGNRSGLSLLTGPNLLDWRRIRRWLTCSSGRCGSLARRLGCGLTFAPRRRGCFDGGIFGRGSCSICGLSLATDVGQRSAGGRFGCCRGWGGRRLSRCSPAGGSRNALLDQLGPCNVGPTRTPTG